MRFGERAHEEDDERLLPLTTGLPLGFRSMDFVRIMGFELEDDSDAYSFPNFVKEMFLDSGTDVLVISPRTTTPTVGLRLDLERGSPRAHSHLPPSARPRREPLPR